MKTLLTRGCILLLFILFAFSCADHETSPCRITKFLWEGEWHTAQYNSSGRLQGLVAPNSKIVMYYDALSRLTSAEIFMGGDPTPFYKFEFTQGPHGIIQTDRYQPTGLQLRRTFFHYAGPGVIDEITEQEFGDSSDPTRVTFEVNFLITYSGGNVKALIEDSGISTYYGMKYDKKRNPFKALAAAVGNDAIFPIGALANFPIGGSSYDISYLNRLSKNNPLRGQYSVMGTGPFEQFFTYTYDGNIAKTLKWDEISYGSTSTSEYAFEFACGPFKAEE